MLFAGKKLPMLLAQRTSTTHQMLTSSPKITSPITVEPVAIQPQTGDDGLAFTELAVWGFVPSGFYRQPT
jgi:hypothetical protein